MGAFKLIFRWPSFGSVCIQDMQIVLIAFLIQASQQQSKSAEWVQHSHSPNCACRQKPFNCVTFEAYREWVRDEQSKGRLAMNYGRWWSGERIRPGKRSVYVYVCFISLVERYIKEPYRLNGHYHWVRRISPLLYSVMAITESQRGSRLWKPPSLENYVKYYVLVNG